VTKKHSSSSTVQLAQNLGLQCAVWRINTARLHQRFYLAKTAIIATFYRNLWGWNVTEDTIRDVKVQGAYKLSEKFAKPYFRKY
jgi:hypothetical protein